MVVVVMVSVPDVGCEHGDVSHLLLAPLFATGHIQLVNVWRRRLYSARRGSVSLKPTEGKSEDLCSRCLPMTVTII